MSRGISKGSRWGTQAGIDMAPFANRLRELLAQRDESMRAAALKAGLDHQTIRRIITGERPNIRTCIVLADYLDVNPNEFLRLAEWPPLKIFDMLHTGENDLPPEAMDLAMMLTKITEPVKRKRVASAIHSLIQEIVG